MCDGRVALRVIGVLTTLLLTAAACASGASPTEQGLTGEQAPSTSPTTVSALPTTAPIQFDSDSPVDADAASESGGSSDSDEALLTPENFIEPTPGPPPPSSPYENIVLHVNDDVTLVPAFDAPNGDNITIYDMNDIDGVQLEYPLYAETYFGNRLALRVEEYDQSGNWALVQVPVRPNGTTVWVQTAFFTEQRHDYHITIDVSSSLVNVYKGEELLVEQLAVIGRESRPTPVLRSFIDEKIDGTSLGPAYGSWVVSIAAFSEALGTFGGGMPKLALHGTNQPDLMGEAVSSGCVRVPNDVIDFIARNVPVGATVDIIA
ncbi:MAG: L,D-transpeptidase [Actinomycetota bacterium]